MDMQQHGKGSSHQARLEALAARFANATSSDISELVGLCVGPVRSVLEAKFGHMLGDAQLDEAVGTAVERLWEHRASYDPSKGPLQGWLYVLARSALLDLLRQREKSGDRPETWWKNIPSPARDLPIPRPSNTKERQLELVRRGLEMLHEIDRRVILESGDDAKLSRELGLSLEAIRVRRFRAKKRLGRFVTEQWRNQP